MSRTLKVYAKYRCQKRRVSVYDPQIKLQGQWLSEAGIKPGDTILVAINTNRIVIDKVIPAAAQGQTECEPGAGLRVGFS